MIFYEFIEGTCYEKSEKFWNHITLYIYYVDVRLKLFGKLKKADNPNVEPTGYIWV